MHEEESEWLAGREHSSMLRKSIEYRYLKQILFPTGEEFSRRPFYAGFSDILS